MSDDLSDIQKRLCNLLQCGIEAVPRPFAVIAHSMGISEDKTLAEIAVLKSMGVLKRIAANVNYHALGKVSVLVTAHVPAEQINAVAEAVSELAGVSHNYLRNHFYNLWFTLQGQSDAEIVSVLHTLAGQTGTEFYPLPALRIFKLDVRFDALSGGRALLPPDDRGRQFDARVTLGTEELALLQSLQKGIDITAGPFDKFGDVDAVLASIRKMLDSGVIRRIGAVMDYRKLGFCANAMLVCKVEEDRIEEIGTALAAQNYVSHCYQRNTFAGWPYNLFAMLHGPDMPLLNENAAAFAKKNGITCYELLATDKELKKSPVIVSS